MKRTFSYHSILLAVIILFGCGRKSGDGNNESDIHSSSRNSFQLFLDNYESLFRTHFNATGCPGAAVVIVKDSNVIFQKCFGVKEKGKKDSVDVHTVFRLGSLSKGFTSLLTGKLVEEGILNWEEKVIASVPDFALKDMEQARRIEVQHLLSHSTGLPSHTFTNLVEEGTDYTIIKRELKKVDLTSKEGEKYAYQNFTFSLVEEIIEKKTQKKFIDLLKEKIFIPGKMNDASLTFKDWKRESNKAIPHNRNDKRVYEVQPLNDKFFNAVSVGGVCVSISDMGSWLKILLGNRPGIASAQTLDKIFTPFVESSGDDYFDHWDGVKKSYYALGWRILDYGNRKIIHHGGTVNDFRSEIAIDRENKIGVCFLFNAPSNQPTTVVPTFFAMYDMYRKMLQ